MTDDLRDHDATVSIDGGWFDDETGLLGPLAWTAVLGVESARCKRYGRAATVVVIEVSGLEGLTSVWGADVGEVAAARVGAVLHRRSRGSDYVARIGTHRFAALLPETNEIAAVNFVERVRQACNEILRTTDANARVTFGWADATKTRTLVEAAEAAITRLATDEDADP